MPGFDAVARWPELFVGMNETDKDAIRDTVASDYLSGRTPDRGHVAILVDSIRKNLDIDEYMRRCCALREGTR